MAMVNVIEIMTILNRIQVDLAELRTEYNALRTNMLAHDHGSTYGAAALRINGSADSLTGTVTANAADALTHTTVSVPPA